MSGQDGGRLARRFVVRGKVQGVGYRFFARTCAEAIGVDGWIRNRDDGTVEAWAEGSETQLDEFAFDLGRGARFARVEAVDAEAVTAEGLDGFEIRR